MGGFDAEIFAFHYIVKDGMQQTWRVYDFINDCEVDLDARFLKNTLKVTDLNNDGVGEVWIMYKKVCHREVSPWEMRIVMYEGKRKFVMHGFNKVKVAEKEYRGGQYRFNRNFRHASKQIKAFALNLWNKNIMQTSEQQNQE